MNTSGINNLSVINNVSTIIYVDDNPVTLKSFQSLFNGTINILTASSGKEALETLEMQPVQVIIANQGMADMTGVEFINMAKNKWPGLKYILNTEYKNDEVLKQVDDDVIIHWNVNKSLDKEKLEHIIKTAIKEVRLKAELQANEEKYKSVFNSISDVFTRTDMTGKCVMVSPSIFQLLGYTQEEVLGRNLAEFYAYPKERNGVVERLLKSKDYDHEYLLVPHISR